MKFEDKAGTSKDESRLKVVVSAGEYKKNVRNTWDAFMSKFRTAYLTQHPNVMRAGAEECRIMLEEVMRDVEEWSMPEEGKAHYQVKKAGQTELDHDESKATSDKGSNKVVNKGPEKTRATFREAYIHRARFRFTPAPRRSVPEVHKRGQRPAHEVVHLPELSTLGG